MAAAGLQGARRRDVADRPWAWSSLMRSATGVGVGGQPTRSIRGRAKSVSGDTIPPGRGSVQRGEVVIFRRPFSAQANCLPTLFKRASYRAAISMHSSAWGDSSAPRSLGPPSPSFLAPWAGSACPDSLGDGARVRRWVIKRWSGTCRERKVGSLRRIPCSIAHVPDRLGRPTRPRCVAQHGAVMTWESPSAHCPR
jgi:hypothetical protein